MRARAEGDAAVDPQGCGKCGIPERRHARQAGSDGVHVWVRPSDALVKARMVARRAETAAVVARDGALPMPVGPGPLALSEQQIEALAAAGNRVVNNETHEHLCMCDAWPKACVSTGEYYMGAWDVSGLEDALPAVIGLWESMRGGELVALRARVAELEQTVAWRDAERERWADVHALVERAIDKGWSVIDTLDIEMELGPESGGGR
jgi:hypothetical protein